MQDTDRTSPKLSTDPVLQRRWLPSAICSGPSHLSINHHVTTRTAIITAQRIPIPIANNRIDSTAEEGATKAVSSPKLRPPAASLQLKPACFALLARQRAKKKRTDLGATSSFRSNVEHSRTHGAMLEKSSPSLLRPHASPPIAEAENLQTTSIFPRIPACQLTSSHVFVSIPVTSSTGDDVDDRRRIRHSSSTSSSSDPVCDFSLGSSVSMPIWRLIGGLSITRQGLADFTSIRLDLSQKEHCSKSISTSHSTIEGGLHRQHNGSR